MRTTIGHRITSGTQQFARSGLLAAVLLFAAACSDDTSAVADDPADSTADSTAGPASTTTSLQSGDPTTAAAPGAELAPLPVRDGPPEETTNGVPHIQTSAELVPEVDAELRRRVFLLPGVEERESALSLPGARSLWLADDLELARPELLQAGREFAHIHPDGSLHVWLPVERAFEVAENGWGQIHPWVGREDFWDGVVMVYTPETMEQLDVVVLLAVDAYNYVTGADVDPATVE